jgi:protein O-GlcNAc transferase
MDKVANQNPPRREAGGAVFHSRMTPAQLQTQLTQAIALHRAGRLDQAEAIYARVRVAAPRNFDGWHLGGTVALQQNRLPEAVELLTKALQLDPRSAVGQMRLGVALLTAGRSGEAEPRLRQAVQLQPNFHEAWDNLAYCLKTQDKLVPAVECHHKCTTLKPDYAVGWYNFGLTLSLLGRSSDALRCHNQALAVDPKFAEAHFGRAQALQQTNRIAEAVVEYEAYLKLKPEVTDAWSYRLLALNNLPGVTREQLFAEHVAYGRRVAVRNPPRLQADPSPERRLRVAILSPDLRMHSCAYFLEPLIRHLNRDEFELYLYNDHFREDKVSERLRGLAAVWRNFVGQAGPAVEKVIRADRPDILIDLAGHTGMTGRLPLFARRLAPVQVNYLGYPNTTGLTEMDCRFTDALADPPGEADAFATERLVRFAPSAWTYAPPPVTPPVAPTPCAATGTVTFGCFNNLGKLTEPMMQVWAQLLAEVPGSRLLLKGRGMGDDPEVRRHYQERLAAAGIPGDRVEMLERTQETSGHLELYQRVDVALDTFPYHGTTTTCEALWMGVPVVTLAGDRHASRVGVSLLTNAGHPEWIARSTDEYVRLARELAADPARLQAVRGQLRQDLARSVLMDHTGQAAAFASALRQCWREWCARQTAAQNLSAAQP